MTKNQQLTASDNKRAYEKKDYPALPSSAPFPQLTPAVERYRGYKQIVEGPNVIKEAYPIACTKVRHYTELVEKVTMELSTMNKGSMEYKKTQRKLKLAQKNLEEKNKWKEILKANAELLMILTHLPFMLVDQDNIYARTTLLYFYTRKPYMDMMELPREEDRIFIHALRAEAKKIGGIPKMELMEEVPKRESVKVVKSRKRKLGEPKEGTGKSKRVKQRG